MALFLKALCPVCMEKVPHVFITIIHSVSVCHGINSM